MEKPSSSLCCITTSLNVHLLFVAELRKRLPKYVKAWNPDFVFGNSGGFTTQFSTLCGTNNNNLGNLVSLYRGATNVRCLNV